MLNTREKILDAFERFVIENNGKIPSNIELAQFAGVAKGAMYYHFKDKEALIDLIIAKFVNQMKLNCTKILSNSNMTALEKMAALFAFYLRKIKNQESFLYAKETDFPRQKILKSYIFHLTPIITNVIDEGCSQQLFNCQHPAVVAEFLLSELMISLDPTIFSFTDEELRKKMFGLSYIMEKLLETSSNSFNFFFETI
jgi:Transcriptional regulator